MITADQALQRLKDGNQRFVSGEGGRDLDFEHARRVQLVNDQAPFAIVLGCSDSRVPLELVFDQGMGDLFVIRVAGNIAAASQIGSIEFAADSFGAPLVVVMGHTRCGAVTASLEYVRSPKSGMSPHLEEIVRRIVPAVRGVRDENSDLDDSSIAELAVHANVKATVAELKNSSELLDDRIRRGLLNIVGAVYSLHSGEVIFLP